MRKAKPLTSRERLLQLRLPKLYSVIWTRDGGERERTASEFRRIIKQRRKTIVSTWDKSYSKYENARESFRELRQAIDSDDFGEFDTAFWKVRNAMKFQGYLQLSLVFCEEIVNSMSDDEVNRQVLLEEI